MRLTPIVLLAFTASGAAAQSAQEIDVPTPSQQIALAVLPLPQSMRENATVLGYRRDGSLVRLRLGDNGLICLADDPREPRFHVSCYHEGLEPFMRRGREIRAQYGITGRNRNVVDSLRLREIRARRYSIPNNSVLYQIFAESDSVDVAAGRVRSPSYLDVVYMPYATTRSTGLTTDALRGTPWLMFPNTPWAHIMIVH